MKIRNTLPHLTAVLFLIIAFTSCQEDFGTLGSDVIGSENLSTILDDNSKVIAYSRRFGAVQTNDLPLRQLGTYNDPVYGKSKIELVSQLSLLANEPDFGFDTVLDSVVLYIPYISEATVTEEATTYTLDSIYGSNPINIKIYESNFFLRDFDPEIGLSERQKYYSTLKSTIMANPSNIGELLYEVTNFLPSDEGHVLITPDGDDEGDDPDEELAAPGLRVKLPISFFQERIIDMEGSTELMNNNNFKEYFRGLYFEVDDQNTDGNLFLFDIAQANVNLFYSYKVSEDDEEFLNRALSLVFSGNVVSLYTNEDLPGDIAAVVDSPNTVEGEERLYLRGGEGIVTIINLFGDDEDENGVPDKLDQMRAENWLVNEANLIFYVDQDRVTGGESEPDRLYLFDAKNNSYLQDFVEDGTSSAEPFGAIINHLGPLVRGSDEHGEYYKIRLTYYINSLIRDEGENVPLVLTVTNNVLAIGLQDLKNSIEIVDPNNPNPDDDEEDDFRSVTGSSIITHEGTVLYGNRAVNEEKRLKLQIYYTEPN